MKTAEQIQEALGQPLHISAIKTRKNFSGGGELSYIEAHHAIREANRIFGPLGWSRETLSCEIVCTSPYDGKNNKPMVAVSYVARVRVTVEGVSRDGVGYGDGQAGADRAYSAHELAAKEAESDAMKRALMTFGDPFGLALYEKDKSKANVSTDRQGPTPITKPSKAGSRSLYTDMQSALDGCVTLDDVESVWADERFQDDRSSLPADWQSDIDERYNSIFETLKQKAA